MLLWLMLNGWLRSLMPPPQISHCGVDVPAPLCHPQVSLKDVVVTTSTSSTGSQTYALNLTISIAVFSETPSSATTITKRRAILQQQEALALSDRMQQLVVELAAADASVFADSLAAEAASTGVEVSAGELNEVTAALASPEVDVIGGLLSSLASGLASLADRQASLVLRAAEAGRALSPVVGVGAAEEQSAADASVTSAYSELLRDSGAQRTAFSGDLGEVLAGFDRALMAQARLQESLNAALQKAQESLAAQAAFLKEIGTTYEFLQSIVGPGWDGKGD